MKTRGRLLVANMLGVTLGGESMAQSAHQSVEPPVPAVPLQQGSATLDSLIAKVKSSGESQLLIEHLQTAHAYLQGAMPEECIHNLEMAHTASAELSAGALESEVKQAIASLVRSLRPSAQPHWHHHLRSNPAGADSASASDRPRATATGLGEFFHGSGISLGIFYPKKHVVAVFPAFDLAQAGRDVLSGAGFRMWEVIAVPGEEVAQFLEELRAHRSLWSDLMVEFSRVLDTEAGLVDCYGQWARRGSGFLIAYSPTQAEAEGIFELLKPLDPVAVHWFMAGYIRHLL